MRKHVCRILAVTAGLLILSCSRSATPGGQKTPGNSSGTPCTANAPCADASETCDLLWPLTPGGSGGTCRQKCNPKGPACSNTQETCNPITGACELDCGQESNPQFCKNNLPNISSLSAVCVSGHYCAFVDTNPGNNNCEGRLGLKGAGGFCKVPCQSYSECPGSSSEYGSWQTCDPITGTCEVGCDPSKTTNSCAQQNYGPAPGTPVGLACSEITATCVPSCTVSSTTGSNAACTGLGNVRTNCYSPGYQTTVEGTCEKPCISISSCNSTTLTCAEGVCQARCAEDSGCTTNKKRSRCDDMTSACAMGCATNTTCAPHGLVCSPISATCVAGCNPSSSQTCPAQDTLRNGCLNASIGNTAQGYSSCEVGCTGWQTQVHQSPSVGTCAAGLKNYYCAQNPNPGTGLTAGYCGIQCGDAQGDCSALNHSQTCQVAGVCSL